MQDKKSRVHIYVYGRVQGVYYRQTAINKSIEFDLKGWVRNLSDGGVELVIEGDESAVEKMIKWCHEGPVMSRVIRVDVQKEQFLGSFDNFKIKSTY